jgi:hypothetical protein
VTGNLEHSITCHFCFEEFEIDAEVQEDFTGHNTEIMTASYAATPTSYPMRSITVKSVL